MSSDDMKVKFGFIGFIKCKYVRLYCALIALAKSDAIKRLLITTLLLCDAMRCDTVRSCRVQPRMRRYHDRRMSRNLLLSHNQDRSPSRQLPRRCPAV